MIKKLFQPVDIAVLVYFRIFGATLISLELVNSILIGDIAQYEAADFHFSYQLFPWISPWPETGMYIHYGITIAAGLLVAAGFFYRFTTIIFFLGFTSLFFMEETEYINHTYLYCLITFWMIFLPLPKAFSYDVKRNPSIQSSAAPAWSYYLLLFQISVVYFYAGLAKLNLDWLSGSPMDMVIPFKGNTLLLGPLLTHPLAPYLISYGGLIFDLTVVPLMLWKKTRLVTFMVAVTFHLSNALIFGLATFPWFSIMMTSLFFNPSWPRHILKFKKFLPSYRPAEDYSVPDVARRQFITYALFTYATMQILLPLRHWLYPGNVNWTEEGHYFSWRMMLRSKTGKINYFVTIPERDTTFTADPLDHITYAQYTDLTGKPELIIQYAHFLAEKYQQYPGQEVEVKASSKVSLNGRPPYELIDTLTNLAAEERSLLHYEWIKKQMQKMRRSVKE